MRVPARIYGTERLVQEMDDAVYDQVTNVATLPGITKYALCMPEGIVYARPHASHRDHRAAG
jgi:tRNA-splicing ligase RtcB